MNHWGWFKNRKLGDFRQHRCWWRMLEPDSQVTTRWISQSRLIYWNFNGQVRSSSSKVLLENNYRNIEFHSNNSLDTQQLLMDIRIRLSHLSYMPLPCLLKLLCQVKILLIKSLFGDFRRNYMATGTEILTIPEMNFIFSVFYLKEVRLFLDNLT